MPRIALLTCRDRHEPDIDQEPLLEALRRRGMDATGLAWDDPQASPEDFDLCVLRSTWNYHLDHERFLAWLGRAAGASRLLNPLPVVQSNVHKGYLLELEARGVPVVPTELLERGSGATLEEVRQVRGWRDVVVKPAVSASSFRTRRFRGPEGGAGEEFLARLLRERDVLVQPTMPGFARPGESALVWLDGEFTHVVTKRVRLEGDAEQVSKARPPTSDERAFGRAVLGELPEELLYARIDVLRDEGGWLVLSELELIEPTLYLPQHPPAVERLVTGIARRV